MRKSKFSESQIVGILPTTLLKSSRPETPTISASRSSEIHPACRRPRERMNLGIASSGATADNLAAAVHCTDRLDRRTGPQGAR